MGFQARYRTTGTLRRAARAAPFAAAAVGYALVLTVAFTRASGPLESVVVASAALTGLVVCRQMIAVRGKLRRLSERAVEVSEARFRALVQNSSDVITILDEQGRIVFASPSAERVLGYEAALMHGRRLVEFVDLAVSEEANRLLENASHTRGVTTTTEWRLQRADGTWIQAENRVTNLFDEPGVRGLVVNTRDVSERSALQDELVHQAFHDGLTGLPNRALFRDRVEHALRRGERGNPPVALLFVDVDDFKAVNDSLGHSRGDALLATIAERLRACVRGGDTVARLGGDEFALLLEDTASCTEVQVIANRVVDSFREPFLVDDREVLVTASVGITVEQDGDTVEVLLRNADVAMYAAKSHGRARCESYAPEMHAHAVEQVEIQTELSHALDRRECFLVYQPIVSLATREISGVEALLRWWHPTRGMIPPSTMIPIAERSGLIVALGHFALRRAAADLARFRRVAAGGEPLTLTVNLSPRQLREPGLLAVVSEALAESGADPRGLVLEVTEGALLEDDATVTATLAGLRALGVRLAIDDFGTGYSALSYLQRFPVDVLKVDKSFIDGVREGRPVPALARAIVDLGRSLNLSIVAEGVETEYQATRLAELGCHMGQGFLFARPVKPETIEEWLAAAQPLPVP